MLPAAVDAELYPHARAARLRLRLHDLYGRLAEAGPASADVEFTHRDEGRIGLSLPVELTPDADRATWSGELPVDLSALGSGTWDLRLRVHYRDGSSRDVTAHAVGGGACCAAARSRTCGTASCWCSRTAPMRGRWRCAWRPDCAGRPTWFAVGSSACFTDVTPTHRSQTELRPSSDRSHSRGDDRS